MKLKDRLIRFMYGRYGQNDALNKFLLWVYFITLFAGALMNLRWLVYFPFIVIVYCMYRMLSRNIAARQKENAAFLRFAGKLKTPLIRFKDKSHVYRRCPHCKATIRLPKKKGKHTVCCPACHTDFDVKI